jgi:hypothetical protein
MPWVATPVLLTFPFTSLVESPLATSQAHFIGLQERTACEARSRSKKSSRQVKWMNEILALDWVLVTSALEHFLFQPIQSLDLLVLLSLHLTRCYCFDTSLDQVLLLALHLIKWLVVLLLSEPVQTKDWWQLIKETFKLRGIREVLGIRGILFGVCSSCGLVYKKYSCWKRHLCEILKDSRTESSGGRFADNLLKRGPQNTKRV